MFCVKHVATCAQLVSDGSKPHLIQDIQYHNSKLCNTKISFWSCTKQSLMGKQNESHFFLGAVAAGSYTRGWEKWR